MRVASHACHANSLFCGPFLVNRLREWCDQREETLTAKKLVQSGSEPHDTKELHDRMSELQSEMFRLEVQNKKLSHMKNGEGDILTPDVERALLGTSNGNGLAGSHSTPSLDTYNVG